ncbi:hypothetical protein PV08_07744 [Exophiala spinifera]|uniref:Xylanolytic transcriptional activator regulatory domain-containing protein n=1 Tax=Exophiala spinifera TaxID=91928 RepID=A0A0D1ZQA5_9EURO|nr:uncharacterized protein PV08_07744 [Exophiala spinifera]KIW14957.1 hypothetical protein PV08_07744 [Exophiala spinifera]
MAQQPLSDKANENTVMEPQSGADLPPVSSLGRNGTDTASSQIASVGRHNTSKGTSFSIPRSYSFGDHAFDNVDPDMLREREARLNRIASGTNHPDVQDAPSGTYTMPSLGDQPFNDSPVSIRDEFTAWLFEDAVGLPSAPFSLTSQVGMGFANTSDIFATTNYSNFFAESPFETTFPAMVQQGTSSSPSNVSDMPLNNKLLSPAKRQLLIALIQTRFNEGDNALLGQLREEIFCGNMDSDDHVLSLCSMQQYIASYWYHFNAQMPIMHLPTFSADGSNEYLLLAMMVVGATYLTKAHGRSLTDSAARFATFIAWHLRWQIFMHNDFQPPTKLWVLQTLLLLEVYEKMNSTRLLHERAHIHHATTINLMRRGTTLIETQKDSRREALTREEWWNCWITAEATRRVVFAAFYLDAVNAIMFGHTAMMVVHEVRLPLPCDEALWSATSAAEVGRVEASLHANSIKPISFLDGLKKTLTGRKVRTNTFGRMILMAGLLSVSWHMHQRDLQVSSLGVSSTLGVPDGWRNPLSKAFDFWKKDFDENMDHMRRAALPWQKNDSGSMDEVMANTATVMYHLSHIATNIDLWDCQIFAGIKRLFGRKIAKPDYERVKAKVFDWSKSPGATIAVYHAIQLLKSVLLSRRDQNKPYNARDDYLLMRPWVTYYAALVVWSYGFALDGVLRPFPDILQPISSPGGLSMRSHSSSQSHLHPSYDSSESSLEAATRDAQGFLQTVGAVKSPQQLETIRDGRNNVAGLLTAVEISFRDCRWDLLHEAADLLRNAVMLLRGASRG